MSDGRWSLSRAASAATAYTVSHVAGGAVSVTKALYEAWSRQSTEGVIAAELQQYLAADIDIRSSGAIEYTNTRVKFTPNVKYLVYKVSGLVLDLERTTISQLSIVIDAGNVVLGERMSASAIRQLKKQAKDEDQSKTGGLEHTEDETEHLKDTFLRLTVDELLIQAPGVAILMRGLNVRVTAGERQDQPSWQAAWDLKKAEAVRQFRAELEASLDEEQLRQFRELHKDDEFAEPSTPTSSGVETEANSPTAGNKSQDTKDESFNWVRGIISDKVLMGIDIKLSGTELEVDTAASDANLTAMASVQLGELHVTHATFFGEVEQHYLRHMKNGQGAKALDFHLRHLPLKIALRAQPESDKPGACVRVFSKGNQQQPILKLLMAPPVRLRELRQGSHTTAASLLQIEVQHDEWRFFDIGGHLWSLEITHGYQNERMLWVPDMDVPVLQFRLSTRMNRISNNFKWLRRCFQAPCMPFEGGALYKEHGLQIGDNVLAVLQSHQADSVTCQNFLASLAGGRVETEEARKAVSKHRDFLDSVVQTWEAQQEELPSMIREQLQLQKDLRSDDEIALNSLVPASIIMRTEHLKKFLRDKISLLQFHSEALFEKLFWAEVNVDLRPCLVHINPKALLDVYTFFQDSATTYMKNLMATNTAEQDDQIPVWQRKSQQKPEEDAADKDQDGACSAEEWFDIVGEHAVDKHVKTIPELVVLVCAKLVHIEMHAEAEQIQEQYHRAEAWRESIDVFTGEPVSHSIELLKQKTAQVAAELGHQARNKPIRDKMLDLGTRMTEPELNEDTHVLMEGFTTLQKELRDLGNPEISGILPEMEHIWLALVAVLDDRKSANRKFVFYCNKLGDGLRHKLSTAREMLAREATEQALHRIDELTSKYGAHSLLDGKGQSSVLGLDIDVKMVLPQISLCMYPDRGGCSCSQGQHCGFCEMLSINLGTVNVTSPASSDEWERPIADEHRQNNQIKVSHQFLEFSVRQHAPGSKMTKHKGDELDEAISLFRYPRQVNAIVQWQLWPGQVQLTAANLAHLEIDVFAFDDIQSSGDDAFDGMVGVLFPPEMTLFCFRLGQYCVNATQLDERGHEQEDKMAGFWSMQAGNLIPVKSMLPVKATKQIQVSLRTHFETFIGFGTGGKCQQELDSTVLLLMADSFQLLLNGTDTTIQASKLELQLNVAHMVDLVGGIKPLLIDEAERRVTVKTRFAEVDPKELTGYAKYLYELEKDELSRREHMSDEEIFKRIAFTDYSDRARAKLVCPTHKAQPALHVQMIKTHGSVDGVAICTPLLVAQLADGEHKIQVELDAVQIKIDGLTADAMLESYFKGLVAQDPKVAEWKRKKALGTNTAKDNQAAMNVLREHGIQQGLVTKIAGEEKLLQKGVVKRLAIFASKITAKSPMEARDAFWKKSRTEYEEFAHLFTEVDVPIHQLFFSCDLDVWLVPMFEAFEPPERKSLKTYLRRGRESIVELAAREPYKEIVDVAIDHHELGFDHATLLTNGMTGGWHHLIHSIQWILYYKPASVNPDNVNASMHNLNFDFVCLWPFLGIFNRTGSYLGINEWSWAWSANRQRAQILFALCWNGANLDMLSAHLGLLMYIIVTSNSNPLWILHSLPVTIFLLIIVPSWLHALTRLWSRPRLFVVAFIAWRLLTFHRGPDLAWPYSFGNSGYTTSDILVDLVMTYCVVVGCFGTFSAAIAGTSLFRQKLEPPWAHRRAVMMLAGGFYVYLGLVDVVAAAIAKSQSTKENDCDPTLSLGGGSLKLLIGTPFLVVPQMFRFLRLNTALTEDIPSTNKAQSHVTQEDAKSLLNQQWWASVSNVTALVMLSLGLVEVVVTMTYFSERSIPSPFTIEDVYNNDFNNRIDDSGISNALSDLCRVQKGNLLLNIGMLLWILYAAIFSLIWRIAAWTSMTRIRAHEKRVTAVMKERMGAGGGTNRSEKPIDVPPAWAAPNQEWSKWVDTSNLAVVQLAEILGNTVLTKSEAQDVAIKIAKQAVYGNFDPSVAISTLKRRGDMRAAEAIEDAIADAARGYEFHDVDDEYMDENTSIHEHFGEKTVVAEMTDLDFSDDDEEIDAKRV